MTVGSLFSGAGGMDLGLARAGFRHAFLCEIDEWRRSVLTRRFPGVPIHTDVRRVAVDPRDGLDADTDQTLGRVRNWHRPGNADRGVDLLAGGFPCQDLSVAGRRAGLAGDRSGLFFEFARVADALVRPGGWVLIENVPGLLSSNGGRDLAVVLATLAELGFMDGAWRVLDARHFGVPQRRRRVFIVARRAPHGARARQVLLEPEGGRRDPSAGGSAGAGTAGRTAGGADVVSTLGTPRGGGHGLNAEKAAGGHLQVVNALDRRRGGADDNEAQAGHLVPVAFHLTQDPIHGDSATPSLGRTSTGMGVRANTGVRRLTPVECERLMGWPDDWTAPGPDSRRYAACGDGVVAPVAEWIGRRLLTVAG